MKTVVRTAVNDIALRDDVPDAVVETGADGGDLTGGDRERQDGEEGLHCEL